MKKLFFLAFLSSSAVFAKGQLDDWTTNSWETYTRMLAITQEHNEGKTRFRFEKGSKNFNLEIIGSKAISYLARVGGITDDISILEVASKLKILLQSDSRLLLSHKVDLTVPKISFSFSNCHLTHVVAHLTSLPNIGVFFQVPQRFVLKAKTFTRIESSWTPGF